MPSLIGSAPNQVPTNGMLGTMAFQDATSAVVNSLAVTDSAVVPTKDKADNSNGAANTAYVNSFFAFKDDITTTTGTATAYVLTPAIPVVSAYSIGSKFQVKFHTTCGVSPTINISGVGAKSLVFKQSDGTFNNAESGYIVAGEIATIRYLPVTDVFEVIDRRPASGSEASSGTNNSSFITPLGLRSGLNASGSAPVYACRAWVNFNGTGTVAIRASGNVSSITDNGTGSYKVNFTTAMPDANYAVAGISGDGGSGATVISNTLTRGTLSYDLNVVDSSDNTNKDSAEIYIAIFR